MEKLSLIELKNYIASNGVVAAKEKYEKQVLEANDPFQSLLFCLNIKTADIKAHEQIMLNGNDLASAYQFVMDVEGADKKEFEKKFLDAKEIKYNYSFARKIEGADVDAHGKIVLEGTDLHYIYVFARDCKVSDIQPYQTAILNSNDPELLYKFAKKVKGANIYSFYKKILDYKTSPFFHKFVEELEIKKGKTRTLAIIKPDGMKNIEKIIEMFYQNGLKIAEYDIRMLDEEILAKHYSHLTDKPFYGELVEFMMSGEVAVMILQGEDAVNRLRNLMGPTDSTKAEPNTIRGMFGTDKQENAIHGSDSVENAEIEIERFFNQNNKIKTK